MSVSEVFVVFLVSHLAGDYLVQTDWQAKHKFGGLSGSGVSRRALFTHVLTYTVVFIPALIWLAGDISGAMLIATAALIAVPHLIVDDGRLLRRYVVSVKGARDPDPGLLSAVDQAVHLICLFAVAVLVAAS